MLCCGAFVEKSFFENIGVNGSLMIWSINISGVLLYIFSSSSSS
jgi:hypothetical protein